MVDKADEQGVLEAQQTILADCEIDWEVARWQFFWGGGGGERVWIRIACPMCFKKLRSGVSALSALMTQQCNEACQSIIEEG
jgi:hypothetical protein